MSFDLATGNVPSMTNPSDTMFKQTYKTSTDEPATPKQLQTLVGVLHIPLAEAATLTKAQAGLRIRAHFEKDPWVELLWCPACGELHEIRHRYSYHYVQGHQL